MPSTIADAGGGQVVADRDALDRVGLTQLAERQHQRDEGAGDGGGARAAVGLDDVAVEPHRPLAQVLEPHHRAQRAADQPLNLLRAAADLARGGFALRARVGGARQHAVLGRHPALARAAQKRRHAILDARRADHARAADLDQHRAFGVDVDAGRQLKRTQLVGLTEVCSHRRQFPAGAAGLGGSIHSVVRASGRRRSTWPASVSTSRPSMRICTRVMRRQILGQRRDQRVDGEDLVERAAGVVLR